MDARDKQILMNKIKTQSGMGGGYMQDGTFGGYMQDGTFGGRMRQYRRLSRGRGISRRRPSRRLSRGRGISRRRLSRRASRGAAFHPMYDELVKVPLGIAKGVYKSFSKKAGYVKSHQIPMRSIRRPSLSAMGMAKRRKSRRANPLRRLSRGLGMQAEGVRRRRRASRGLGMMAEGVRRRRRASRGKGMIARGMMAGRASSRRLSRRSSRGRGMQVRG